MSFGLLLALAILGSHWWAVYTAHVFGRLVIALAGPSEQLPSRSGLSPA